MWLSIASKLVPGIIKTGMSIASNRRRTKELELNYIDYIKRYHFWMYRYDWRTLS